MIEFTPELLDTFRALVMSGVIVVWASFLAALYWALDH